MIEPWEEVWDPDSLLWLSELDGADPRRSLAACAPEMARMLLELVRWMRTEDARTGEPFAGDSHTDVVNRMLEVLDSANALLTKAGVR